MANQPPQRPQPAIWTPSPPCPGRNSWFTWLAMSRMLPAAIRLRPRIPIQRAERASPGAPGANSLSSPTTTGMVTVAMTNPRASLIVNQSPPQATNAGQIRKLATTAR